jgi:N-acetylmuramoyl-L-alanine amidase
VWVSAPSREPRHAKVHTVLPARHAILPALAVLLACLSAGCGGSQVDSMPAAASVSAPPGVKRVVLIDPGHNGGNAAHLAEINKKVPDGRGDTKPCNTVGASTTDGFPEHQFNWDVADDLRDLLQSNGVTVVLTHDDNDGGVGPCVDVRGEMAAKVNADAVISIHADGAPAADHGFHVIYSKPALNTAQGAPSIALATAIRDGMSDQMLPTSNYVGKNGLIGRSDLAGLNLAKRPAILIECGNMKNSQDAINMKSDAGQARIAQGIATGVLNWLARNPPGSLALAKATPLKSTSSASSASTSSTAKKHSASKSTKPTTEKPAKSAKPQKSTSTPSTESETPTYG